MRIRVAFLCVALGTPLSGLIDWLLLRLTFVGGLGANEWQYLVFWVAAYPVLTALFFAFLPWEES